MTPHLHRAALGIAVPRVGLGVALPTMAGTKPGPGLRPVGRPPDAVAAMAPAFPGQLPSRGVAQ